MTAYLQQHFIFYLFCMGLLGLIIGSFLNVVIYRLPIMLDQRWRWECSQLLKLPLLKVEQTTILNLCLPRSHCIHCQRTIYFFDNIPLISFLWLKGRCRHCGEKISWRYPLVEVLSAFVCIVIALRFGVGFETIAGLIFSEYLLCLAFIDLKHQLLPDVLTLSLLWLGLIASLLGFFASPGDAIIGASCGYFIFWAINQIFLMLRKKPGMGHGDFKLLAALGAWFGWMALPFIIFFSSLLGVCVGLSLILFKNRHYKMPIPFGPFLALAGCIYLLLEIKLFSFAG
jgi:leader peptidase (prepilin peptidase)/N-methyltransferase